MDRLVIGIGGGSGSGKTTFSKKLKSLYGESISLVSCDNYYYPNDDLPMELRQKLNYDSPDAFDFDFMAKQIDDLRHGRDIDSPVYDYTIHTRSKDTLLVKSNPVIVIDGILAFYDKSLRDLMDLKIFVEADADERILRRARRDMIERGRTIDSVIDQYLSTVKPMHNQYVEPTKKFADMVIYGGKNEAVINLVCSKIDAFLKEHNSKEKEE